MQSINPTLRAPRIGAAATAVDSIMAALQRAFGGACSWLSGHAVRSLRVCPGSLNGLCQHLVGNRRFGLATALWANREST